jgi:hypothetical protein
MRPDPSWWLLHALGAASCLTPEAYHRGEADAGTGGKLGPAAAGDVAWTDVTVQARVKIVSWAGSSSSDYAGVCARLADADDYTCLTLRGDTKVALREDGAGSSGTAGSSVAAGLTTGTWYKVTLTVAGNGVTGALNDVMVLPKAGDAAVAPGSPAGGIALIVDNAEAEFDDVTVTVP